MGGGAAESSQACFLFFRRGKRRPTGAAGPRSRLVLPAPTFVMPLTTTAIRLDFQPCVELISSARRFVSDFCDAYVADPDAVSRAALTTHELLENVVKYSSDGITKMEIELLDGKPGEAVLSIRARNRTTPERMGELIRLVDELEKTQDPLGMYLQVMIRSAAREEGSGLGLARIRAEAEMDIHCDVDGDEVTIIAKTLVPTRQGAAA